MYQRPAAPPAPAEFVRDLLADAEALGLTDTVAPLRPLAEAIEQHDEAEDDLATNLDPVRARLVEGLDAGTVTVTDAVDQWTQARARLDAVADVRRMVAQVRGTRANAALTAARRIDWWSVLTPLGAEAAARVVELAEKVGPGMTDAAAVRATENVRRAWVELAEAIVRWRGLGELARTVMWAGLAPHDPLPADRLDTIDPQEWAWSEPLRLAEVDATAPEAEQVLAQVHATAGPAFVTPAELQARLLERDRLRDASPLLAQLGYPVPGADVPRDAPLPAHVLELVGRT